ncbi:hypothetical protein FEM48_Zijuj07G0005700 [Ziziphus jujuba var. spinosa]|uniref:Uncharacterized protein n=1 Tax=Ziziphus jujuba var. spinosa TaxID=714518 RepID=A0A978V1E5_ZIZJJ|nr:hypothetical protein FEM48_Zijuj07G0005700 [Ziziphus jujuba var. spinosa]
MTNIRFIHLPTVDPPSDDQFHSSMAYISLLIGKHKSHVKHAVSKLIESSNSESTARVAGLFIDMFCTSMIDVAGELGVPCYLFFQSPATFFSFMLDLPSLDAKLLTELSDSITKFSIRGFENPVLRLVLPNTVLCRVSILVVNTGAAQDTTVDLPSEYVDFDQTLPSGFVERTVNMGLELSLAVEIRLDYKEGSDLILAEEVERGIKMLMNGEEEVREKVREMRKKSRMALMENGSSIKSLGELIKELMANN